MTKKEKENVEKLSRREFKYPNAFKNAKVIRDGKIRRLRELSEPKMTKSRRQICDLVYKEIEEIDYKIDALEILFKSMIGEEDLNHNCRLNGVCISDLISGVLTDTFNYLQLVPLNNNIDYLSAMYLLLYGDHSDNSRCSDLVVSSQLEWFYNNLKHYELLQETGKDVSDYLSSIKQDLLQFIVVFTGNISLEELFKTFNFSSSEFKKIIQSYSAFGKDFEWYDYFRGRYYLENPDGPLFDLEVISDYLKYDSSILEKEELVDHLIEFLNRIDKWEELQINTSYLYDNDEYIIQSLEMIMNVIEEDRKM